MNDQQTLHRLEQHKLNQWLDELVVDKLQCDGYNNGNCKNDAEYILRDKEETWHHCRPCFEEQVVDIVEFNHHVEFTKIGDKEFRL